MYPAISLSLRCEPLAPLAVVRLGGGASFGLFAADHFAESFELGFAVALVLLVDRPAFVEVRFGVGFEDLSSQIVEQFSLLFLILF